MSLSRILNHIRIFLYKWLIFFNKIYLKIDTENNRSSSSSSSSSFYVLIILIIIIGINSILNTFCWSCKHFRNYGIDLNKLQVFYQIKRNESSSLLNQENEQQ